MSESDRRLAEILSEALAFRVFSGTKRLVQEIYFVRKDFSPALVAGFAVGGSSTSERVDAELKYADGAPMPRRSCDTGTPSCGPPRDVEDSFSRLAQSELRGDEILVEIAAFAACQGPLARGV